MLLLFVSSQATRFDAEGSEWLRHRLLKQHCVHTTHLHSRGIESLLKEQPLREPIVTHAVRNLLRLLRTASPEQRAPESPPDAAKEPFLREIIRLLNVESLITKRYQVGDGTSQLHFGVPHTFLQPLLS